MKNLIQKLNKKNNMRTQKQNQTLYYALIHNNTNKKKFKNINFIIKNIKSNLRKSS